MAHPRVTGPTGKVAEDHKRFFARIDLLFAQIRQHYLIAWPSLPLYSALGLSP